MTKSYVSSGQGIFVFGIDPTNRIAVDSTKELTAAAECVAGYPLALIAATGKLNTTASATGDMFYGASSSNINSLVGRVSLENWTAARANAELMGRYTIRPSVFLDSVQTETTAHPFCKATANRTVLTSDVGKSIHAIVATVAGGTNATDAFFGVTMLRWAIDGDGDTVAGFENVGRIVAVRDNQEVEVLLNGASVNYSASFTA